MQACETLFYLNLYAAIITSSLVRSPKTGMQEEAESSTPGRLPGRHLDLLALAIRNILRRLLRALALPQL